jgi:hypothetical protein
MGLHSIVRHEGDKSIETTYSFVPLESSHLDALMDLQRIAQTAIADPDLLRVKLSGLKAGASFPNSKAKAGGWLAVAP